MTPQLVKDLFMLQWELNGNLEVGSDQVRRSDIRGWFDPITDPVLDALRDWERQEFVAILTDPRICKDKEVCLKILKRIEAIPEPEDLNESD
jgi:hypothetical protein